MKSSLVGTWTGMTGGVEPVPLTITFAVDGSYVATQTLPDYPFSNTSGEAVPESSPDYNERTREETVHGTYTIAANRIEARLDVPGGNQPTVEQLIFTIEGDTLTLRNQQQSLMTLKRVF